MLCAAAMPLIFTLSFDAVTLYATYYAIITSQLFSVSLFLRYDAVACRCCRFSFFAAAILHAATRLRCRLLTFCRLLFCRRLLMFRGASRR